jgi:hypothetical protein
MASESALTIGEQYVAIVLANLIGFSHLTVSCIRLAVPCICRIWREEIHSRAGKGGVARAAPFRLAYTD